MANNLDCVNTFMVSDVVLTGIERLFSFEEDQADATVRRLRDDFKSTVGRCYCGTADNNVGPEQIDSFVPCPGLDEPNVTQPYRNRGIVGTTGQPEAQFAPSGDVFRPNSILIKKSNANAEFFDEDAMPTCEKRVNWAQCAKVVQLVDRSSEEMESPETRFKWIDQARLAALETGDQSTARNTAIWVGSGYPDEFEHETKRDVQEIERQAQKVTMVDASTQVYYEERIARSVGEREKKKNAKLDDIGKKSLDAPCCCCKDYILAKLQKSLNSTRMPSEPCYRTGASNPAQRSQSLPRAAFDKLEPKEPRMPPVAGYQTAAQRSQSLPRAPCACRNKAFYNFKPNQRGILRYPTQRQAPCGQPNPQHPSNYTTFDNFSPKLNSTELQPEQGYRTGVVTCPCGIANCRRQLQQQDAPTMTKMLQRSAQQYNQQNARLRINFTNQYSASMQPQPSYRTAAPNSPQQATYRPTNPWQSNNNTTGAPYSYSYPSGQSNDRRQHMLQQQAATRAPNPNPWNMATNMTNPAQRYAVRQGFNQPTMINGTTYMQLPQRFISYVPQFTQQPQMRSEYQRQASYRQPMRPAEPTYTMPMNQRQYYTPGPTQQYATRMDMNQGANNRHQCMNRETDSRMNARQAACCQNMRHPTTHDAACQCTLLTDTSPTISMTDSEDSRNNGATEPLAQPTQATVVQDSYNRRVLRNSLQRQEELKELANKIAYAGRFPAKPVDSISLQRRIDFPSDEVHRRFPTRHSTQYRVESNQRRSISNPNSNRNVPNFRRSSSTPNISNTLGAPVLAKKVIGKPFAYQFRAEVNEAIAAILRA